jgi:DNA-binding CsgD family transcriptional regulator
MEPPDRLVERIYDAGVAEQAWGEVVPEIARLCGARSAVFLIREHDSGTLSFAEEFGMGTAYRSAYLGDLRHDDLRLEDLIRHPLGTVRTDTMISRYGAYQTSRAYRELYSKLGTEHALGAFIFSDGRRSVGLRVFRSRQEGPFGAREVALYEALLPHLARALRLRGLREREAETAAEAAAVLDLLPWGLFLLDEAGGLEPRNRAGRLLLEQAGAALAAELRRIAGRAFLCWRSQGCRDCAALLAARLSGAEGGDWLQATLRILQPPGAARADASGTALVAVAGPQQDPEAASGLLRALYGLTPAEQQVAGQVLCGLPPARAAERLGIAHETARSHLRSIFAKTGVSRQADLVRLALGAPLFAAEAPTGKAVKRRAPRA